MSTSAAIFDLDRTLLDGASWPIYAAKLRQLGVLPDRDFPVVDQLFGVFRSFGESFLTMQLTKLAVSKTKGWPIDLVDEAARLAVDELLHELHPYARTTIDEHRAAGRKIVVATTTPQRLVQPLADALGFDAAIGTRYGEADGCFSGAIDGPFVWNRGKLQAVRAWASANDVSLKGSWGYSDSFFDAPLLDAVGHPTAINPDPRLAALAAVQGWPIRWFDKPPGVPKIAGRELQELLRPFVNPALIPNARFVFSGLEHLPATGAAIVVGNHRSYFDPTAIALALARAGRNARFLGKKEVFDAPIVGQLAAAFGGIRVDRGTGSDEPLQDAARALTAGDVVAIMPQGTIPRGPAFFDPDLKGRWGAARLAALTGAPVIPIGLWGTEKVWPRSARLPKLDLANPPLVSVTVGPPVELGHVDPDADTKAIMSAIVALLPDEAQRPYAPTEDELRRTYPPGYKGDPNQETARRPGTD